MELENYCDIIEELKRKRRTVHLLLGNGFSMDYDPDIFSYSALHKFIDNIDNKLLSKLFAIVNTKDFELVMQQLDNFSQLISAFDSESRLKTDVNEASESLKRSLI